MRWASDHVSSFFGQFTEEINGRFGFVAAVLTTGTFKRRNTAFMGPLRLLRGSRVLMQSSGARTVYDRKIVTRGRLPLTRKRWIYGGALFLEMVNPNFDVTLSLN